MKEAVFIAVVLLILIVLTAIRYRKQLIAVLNIWRMLRSMRQMSPTRDAQISGSTKSAGPLVNCVKCGNWVPETHAIKLGRAAYCSAECVEKSARAA